VRKAPDGLYLKLDKFLRSAERTRSRVEKLTILGHLSRKDAEIVYSALFLSIFTRFETLLEELFFGVLVGRIDGRPINASPRIKVASDQIAREIVHQKKDYLDWLPFNRTEDRAVAFLRGGRPFTALDDGDRSRLKIMLVIRHSIAHRGRHAQEQFREKVLGSLPLTPRERSPAGFLRSQYRISPPQTRLELFSQQVRAIALKLTRI